MATRAKRIREGGPRTSQEVQNDIHAYYKELNELRGGLSFRELLDRANTPKRYRRKRYRDARKKLGL